MKPVSETHTSQELPMSKSTIGCKELRGEFHSQWPETSSRRLKLSEAVPLATCSSDGSRGTEVTSEAYRREALPSSSTRVWTSCCCRKFPGTDRLCRFRDHLEEPSFSPVPSLGNNSDETEPWRCEASLLAVSWYFGRSQCSTVCILLMKQFLPECHLQFFSISAFPCSEFWSLLGPCRFVHKDPRHKILETTPLALPLALGP
jgi:hypothetical protein